MGRTHPPSLIRLVETALKKECGLPPHAQICVAVSGGPDSMALAHALHHLRAKAKFDVSVFTLDHGLRDESKDEVRLVGDFCETLGLPWFTRSLHLKAGANLQERARERRYEALWDMAQVHCGPGAFLATAHHKDDRAETVLLRMLRGTSLEGLSVLSARADKLLRPLIRATRGDVEAHIERHEIPTVTDPSNRDLHYLRVRTRQRLLPLMKELSPGIVDHLVGLADEAGHLPDALGLNREQRGQIRQALRDPSVAVDLPLAGGLRLQRTRVKK